MILSITKIDGARFDVALHEGRSGVSIVVDGFTEPLALTGLTGLELIPGDKPVVVAKWGVTHRHFPVWNESVIAVGWEDAAAPDGTNKQRSAAFVVADIASVELDATTLTVPQPQEVTSGAQT